MLSDVANNFDFLGASIECTLVSRDDLGALAGKGRVKCIENGVLVKFSDNGGQCADEYGVLSRFFCNRNLLRVNANNFCRLRCTRQAFGYVALRTCVDQDAVGL